MKSKKWLTYTLGILLTLVVLAGVAGAGIRIGMMQNASFARPAFMHNFAGGSQGMQDNFQDNRGPQGMQGNLQDNRGPQGMHGNSQGNGDFRGNSRGQGFDNRGGDRRGGRGFFSPIFGLIHLALLGLILWFGYKFVKNSGWRITRVQASPAPVVDQTPSVAVEEKKELE